MRLKLVLISSFIAAIVGAGSAVVIILFAFSSLKPISTPGLLVVSTYLLPTLAILLASIFVYRHTAKRRKLQAALTAIIASVLTISFFVLASILTARREPLQPQPGPQHVGRSAAALPPDVRKVFDLPSNSAKVLGLRSCLDFGK